jgi:flagellar FliL protein
LRCGCHASGRARLGAHGRDPRQLMAPRSKQAEAEEEPETQPEVEGEAEQGAAAPRTKLPVKLIAMVAAALLVIGATGTMAYFLFGNSGVRTAAGAKPAVFVDLPEVLVNLSNTGNDRVQYLKVKVVLELGDQALIQQIQPVMPRVMDAFQTYLRELRPTDLEGSAGLYRLKEELTRRVNVAIAPTRINAVLFKEMVVQ